MGKKLKKILIKNKTILQLEIEKYYKIQKSHFNFLHPDFSKKELLTKAINNLKSKEWSLFGRKYECDDNFEVEIMKAYLNEYYSIVEKEFVDYFIKCCYFYSLTEVEEY